MTQGFYIDDMDVGMTASYWQTVSGDDIQRFAAISGDTNPVHLDQAYAEKTPFKGIIAHGMLSAAYISALIAGKLPGPGAIYLGQSLAFKRPVKIGDEVTVTATITGLDAEKARVTLSTVCTVNGKTVLDGEALIMAPRRP